MTEEIKSIDLGNVNCYLVNTGMGFILIDTGFADNRAVLQKELDASGVTPQNMALVILTHGDIDHSGNCAFLQKKYGVKIGMHRADLDMAENGMFHGDRKVKSFLMRAMQTFFKSRFVKMMADFEKFKPDLFLEEGQSLKDYSWDAVVLHTPGHTNGSICLQTAAGDLIAGDIFQNRGKPGISAIVSNETELTASVAHLKTLNIKTVYPGHGKIFQMSHLSV
jgi:glyoxylase-like metal-dependent hydrolase (beta-lactamase superfamily II)